MFKHLIDVILTLISFKISSVNWTSNSTIWTKYKSITHKWTEQKLIKLKPKRTPGALLNLRWQALTMLEIRDIFTINIYFVDDDVELVEKLLRVLRWKCVFVYASLSSALWLLNALQPYHYSSSAKKTIQLAFYVFVFSFIFYD